jgi:hypothetical protein
MWWDRLRASNKSEYEHSLAALLNAQTMEVLDSLHDMRNQDRRAELEQRKAEAAERLKNRRGR